MGKRSKIDLKSFSKTFWIANVMELFERAAYYGMNSVLAIYLTEKVSKGGLGYSEEAAGFLQAIIYSLTYLIPIAGGALAEKLGYRRILITAFSILSFGYFASGHFSTYGTVFASLCIMATGAGLFKPIISGTIARTTTEKNSSFGFGIYYWMINLGAFLSPILVSYIKGFSWKYIFMASSLWCLLMLLPALFLYKDPELPGKSKTFKETASNALIVLGDSRFMLMIFIYSFFWILYFQSFGSILWYLRDFIDKVPVNGFMTNLFKSIGFNINFVFGEEYVTAINAGTIILLQVFVSKIAKNQPAIPVMCSGMIIGAAGFLILAVTRSPWFFILGLVVFSIGEMTAHPKYYSYIGIVAPHDKKAIYMGYSFLYGVIGSLFGSSFGAYFYSSIMKPDHAKDMFNFYSLNSAISPFLKNMSNVFHYVFDIKFGNTGKFFFTFSALCIIGALGLIIYNKFLAADTPENNRKARKIVTVTYAALVLAGIYIMYKNLQAETINYRMIAQSVILITVGAGGILVTSGQKKGV